VSLRPTVEVLRGWGGVHQGRSLVYRPRSTDETAAALADASARGLTVAHRGSGYSYGDLALNEGGAVVETSALKGILELDPATGRVRARAGTTIEELWAQTLPLGWWPPVVPGTMKVTLGGAVAVNAHGKNHVARGSIGDHVIGLTVLGPDGTIRSLDNGGDAAELGSAIGGLGLTGTILDVTLRLERVHSGLLEVETRTTGSTRETLEALDQGAREWTYAVAWMDAFARAEHAGRGVLSFGSYLPPDHPRAGAAMSVAEQVLPDRMLGLFPRRFAWIGLRPIFRDAGLRVLNVGRYASGRRGRGVRTLEAHARFHFLLDYVPGWQKAYLPHGLVQYQLFVPRAAAEHAFTEALRLQADLGVYSYLAVAKRHRADPFAAAYALDGFSLALDFPVRPARLDRLVRLFRSYDALLHEVGGRLYPAKDGVGHGRLPSARHPLFSSNLVRRWEAVAPMGEPLAKLDGALGRTSA
jgi:decaprenylphospho-beta-D-ribofuranose 2-oxidase